jgi:hypothetical protein
MVLIPEVAAVLAALFAPPRLKVPDALRRAADDVAAVAGAVAPWIRIAP